MLISPTPTPIPPTPPTDAASIPGWLMWLFGMPVAGAGLKLVEWLLNAVTTWIKTRSEARKEQMQLTISTNTTEYDRVIKERDRLQERVDRLDKENDELKERLHNEERRNDKLEWQLQTGKFLDEEWQHEAQKRRQSGRDAADSRNDAKSQEGKSQ